jgi:four helix bundle protein
MRSYRSLIVWQKAHDLCIRALKAADECKEPRTWAFADQLRRAALSVELNIVEGYALQTKPQFVRHVRIALGSAVELERLLEIGGELEYLPAEQVSHLRVCADRAIALLYGTAGGRREPG